MRNYERAKNEDLCSPEWFTGFIQCTFPALFPGFIMQNYAALDFSDYIYPIEEDGVTKYFYNSQMLDFFQLGTEINFANVENLLRSIDLLRKEYLPSCHVEMIRFLVSSLF